MEWSICFNIISNSPLHLLVTGVAWKWYCMCFLLLLLNEWARWVIAAEKPLTLMLNWTNAVVCANFHGAKASWVPQLRFIQLGFYFLDIFTNDQKNILTIWGWGWGWYLLCLYVLARCVCPAIALMMAFSHWKSPTCGCGTRRWNNLLCLWTCLSVSKSHVCGAETQ